MKMKNQYRGENCLTRGAWTVCRFKGGLGKKDTFGLFTTLWMKELKDTKKK